MKFYIAKSLSVVSGRGVRYSSIFHYNFSNIKTELESFLPSDSSKLAKLTQTLKGPVSSWNTHVTMEVSHIHSEDNKYRMTSLKLHDSYLDELSDKQSTGKTTVKIIIELKETICILETKDIAIISGQALEESNIPFPVDLFPNYPEHEQLNAFLTIIVTTPYPTPVEKLEDAEKGIIDMGSLTRCILEQETLSDVTIVSAEETQIKAHKVFLAFHSLVFRTMFQTEMTEATESIIKIPEMTEKGVRAFLKFLYYGDTEDAVNDCVIAFQLFHAGHKYDIKMLEDDMNALILNQPCEWFENADLAVQLFLFARNIVPANPPLLQKTIKILKLNSSNLDKSPAFQKLFKRNAAAMDLCMFALTC